MTAPTIGCIADDYTGGTPDALEEIEETAKLYLLRGHAVRPVTDAEAERLSGNYR